jgi:hypothetical protein
MRVAVALGLFTFVVLTSCVPTGVVCRAGTAACGSGCIDPSSDKRNCGGCGIACGTSQQCNAGLCECGPGTTLCNGECVLLDYDTFNCGGCGQACAAGGTCSPVASGDGGARGTCGCPSGLSVCSNACVATASDVLNCGQCGRACAATQVCSNGVCGAQCAAGETDCAGSCAALATSRLHCGACGRACAAAQDCVAGACVCPAGQTLCGAACVSLTSANTDCGGCGTVCGSGQSCHAGVCSYDVVAACYWSGQAVGFNATTFAKGSLSDLGTNPAALALKQGVLLAADGQDRRVYQAVLSPTGLAQAALATQTGAVPTHVLVDGTHVYVVNAASGTLQTLSEGADAGRLELDAGVAGGLSLGTVSELNFGMNSFPQGVARAGDALWVPLYGGYGVGPAAAGQAVVKVSAANPSAELSRVDLKGLDLHAFDGGAPVARPWAITAHRGALYVVLNNLNPDTYAPEGPGLLARIDPGTSAVTVIDLGAEHCLNPQWAASVGEALVVSCGGQVAYSTTGAIDTVRHAGLVLVDAQDHVAASWSAGCPADAGACAPLMPGRFTVRGARVLLGDQNAGRVVVLDVGDAGFTEVRGVANPLATCPISAVTGAGNVSDLVSLP